MTNTDICPFCEKIINNRVKAICCDLCSKWIHIKCNNFNDLDYILKVIMKLGTAKLVSKKFYHSAIQIKLT